MPGDCRHEQVHVFVRHKDENGDTRQVLRVVGLATHRVSVLRDGVTREVRSLPELRRLVGDGATTALAAPRDGGAPLRVELTALGGTRAERVQRRTEAEYGQLAVLATAVRPGTGQVLSGATRSTLRAIGEDKKTLKDVLKDPTKARETLNRAANAYAPVLAREVREATGTPLTAGDGTKVGSFTVHGSRVQASFSRPSTGYALRDSAGRFQPFARHPASKVSDVLTHVTQSRAGRGIAAVVGVSAAVYAMRAGLPLPDAASVGWEHGKEVLPLALTLGASVAAGSQTVSALTRDRYSATAGDGTAPSEIHRPVVEVPLSEAMPARATAAEVHRERARLEIDRQCTRQMKALLSKVEEQARADASERAARDGWSDAQRDAFAHRRAQEARDEIEASFGEHGSVRQGLLEDAHAAAEELVRGHASADDTQLLYAAGPARWVADQLDATLSPSVVRVDS